MLRARSIRDQRFRKLSPEYQQIISRLENYQQETWINAEHCPELWLVYGAVLYLIYQDRRSLKYYQRAADLGSYHALGLISDLDRTTAQQYCEGVLSQSSCSIQLKNAYIFLAYQHQYSSQAEYFFLQAAGLGYYPALIRCGIFSKTERSIHSFVRENFHRLPEKTQAKLYYNQYRNLHNHGVSFIPDPPADNYLLLIRAARLGNQDAKIQVFSDRFDLEILDDVLSNGKEIFKILITESFFDRLEQEPWRVVAYNYELGTILTKHRDFFLSDRNFCRCYLTVATLILEEENGQLKEIYTAFHDANVITNGYLDNSLVFVTLRILVNQIPLISQDLENRYQYQALENSS